MTKARRFSVVVPVHNRAATVGATLESVRAQDFTDFECIVIDDGSRDGALLESVVASLNDDRFRYVGCSHGGGGAARNAGIREATGEYICFLDSDDMFLPEKLSVVARHAKGEPMIAFYSQALVDRGVGSYWRRPSRAIRPDEDMGEYLFVHNEFIQTSTIVLHRETAGRVQFDPTLRKGQDLDFCIRLHAAGVRFRMLEPPLTVWYDISEAQRTSRTRGYQAELEWLRRTSALLSARAARGYRATVLAYHMARSRPFAAGWYLVDGLVRGGVPAAVTVRQGLRCFLPRRMYRWLVNRWVATGGTSSGRVTPQSQRQLPPEAL